MSKRGKNQTPKRNTPPENGPAVSAVAGVQPWQGLPGWVWLLCGALLLPLTMVQTVVPLAAWAAPTFLLRFSRTTRRRGLAWLGIFAAYAIACALAARGSATTSVEILVVSVVLFQTTRAFLCTLAYAADRSVGRRLSPWLRMLVFPAGLTTAEWILSLGRAPNTTGSIAYSQFSSLAFMQLLSITGMWGIIFLVAWFASVINSIWEQRREWRKALPQVGVYAAVLAAVLVYGQARLAFAPTAPAAVNVAAITLDPAVQQASEMGIDWMALANASDDQRAVVAAQLKPILDQLMDRTETALEGGAKIVVWAEGSGTILEEDYAKTLDRVQNLARTYNAYIEPALAVVARTDSQKWLLNEAVLVGPSGQTLWTYEKSYPTEPVESYYTVAGDGVLPIAYTPYGLMSTAICNDFHFPPLIRQAGSQGVGLFLLPVNEVHPFEAEDQVGATFRAVENGFALLRPADVGVSSMVDPYGRTLATQDFHAADAGIMSTAVPLARVNTIYGTVGDWFAYGCLLTLLGLGLLATIGHPRSEPARAPATT